MAAAGGAVKDTEVRQDRAELGEAIRSAFVTSLDSAGTLIRTQVPQLDELARSGRRTPPKDKTPHTSLSPEASEHTPHDTDS